MKQFCFFILFAALLASPALADTAQVHMPLTKQTISYRTTKANEMFLVWAMDNWKLPQKQFQPVGTIEKDGMAHTPMQRSGNDFEVGLNLPAGTYIDFMFRATKDSNDAATDSWDVNWNSKYNFYVDGNQPIKRFNDEKLYILPSATPPFNIMTRGVLVLAAGAMMLLFVLGLHFFFYKHRKYSLSGLVAGFAVCTFLIMLIIRMQMNGILSAKRFLLFGSVIHDLLYLICLGIAIGLLLFISKRRKVAQLIFSALALLLLSVSLLAALLNIEVVHELGKPLTYGWLYYSDFLQSNDAKNTLSKGINSDVIRNLSMIFGGVLLGGLAISIAAGAIPKKVKLSMAGLFIACFLLPGLAQKSNAAFSESRLSNPVSVFVGSWIQSEAQPPLFSLQVPQATKDSVAFMHEYRAEPGLQDTSIRHIVLFVLESTPATLLQTYDSTYRVTPNLDRWSKHARIYSNMYAHLPSTVNSMFSMLSGLYPLINYKSVVKEYPEFNDHSLPSELKKSGWLSSVFFASDLSYSNIGLYLKNQEVGIAEDCKRIPCSYKTFDADYAATAGIDDRCMVSRYLQCADSLKNTKTLSLLWTNQTHYPYFISEKEEHYAEDKALNTYLNALKASDAAFGMLMKGLEEKRLLDNTLVIVVGDHGEAFGTHNQYTHGSFVYEENMHVPCMLIQPKLFRGERDDRIAGMIDIAPTIASVTGLANPEVWQGNSLLGRFNRSHTFMIGPYSDFQFASRFGQWKLIYNGVTGVSKLFDLRSDPGELKDVSAQNAELVKRELEILAAWVQYHTERMNKSLGIRAEKS